MAYSTIADSEIDTDSPLTESLFTRLRDNPLGIASGSAGAPKIQTAGLEQTGGSEAVTQACVRANAIGQAEMANAAIGIAELKTSAIAVTRSTIGTTFSLLANNHMFWPQLISSNPNFAFWGLEDGANNRFSNTPSTSTYQYEVIIEITASATSATLRFYYVQASPPYDLGDGDVPMFIYAVIDETTGDFIGMSYAPDPPWYSFAKQAQRYDKQGRGWYKEKDLPAPALALKQQIDALDLKNKPATKADAALVKDYNQAFKEAPEIEIEVTQAVKNAAMDIYPLPFNSAKHSANGERIVLLDPVSDLTRDLFELQAAGEDISVLFSSGAIQVSNNILSRAAPKGVDVVAFDWK